MDFLKLVSMCLLVSACGGGSGGGDAPAFAPNPSQPGNVQQPGPGGGNQTQDITVYQRSKTEAPVNGWPTKQYTSTGSCAQVNSKTYCWDDGVKTLQWSSNSVNYGPFTYSFFGVMPLGQSISSCHGGCIGDLVVNPTEVDQQLNNVIGVTVTDVLTHGVPTTVTCNVLGSDLDCASFNLIGGAL